MAAYQFPDNELQDIELLVNKITGGSIGLNQLYNPDESSSEAGEHAMKILDCLQNMRAAVGNEDYEDIDALFNAVKEYELEKSTIKLARTDSNPLFGEVIKKSQQIVAHIKQDSFHRQLFRRIELIELMKSNDKNLYAIDATSNIKKLFENTINELKNINTPSTPTKDKKSAFSKFFSNSNKVAPAPVQRATQNQLDEAIQVLKLLADDLPTMRQDAVNFRILLRVNVGTLSKYIDDLPPNASPLVYNALSRLSAGLQDHLMNINDPERQTSRRAVEIFDDFMGKEFNAFLQTDAGHHYMHTVIKSEDSSPYKTNLSNEEIENFHSTDHAELTDQMTVLLTLLSQDKYVDLYDKMEALYESHLDYLIENSEPEAKPSSKTPRL